MRGRWRGGSGIECHLRLALACEGGGEVAAAVLNIMKLIQEVERWMPPLYTISKLITIIKNEKRDSQLISHGCRDGG
jgi:hypothetical protein